MLEQLNLFAEPEELEEPAPAALPTTHTPARSLTPASTLAEALAAFDKAMILKGFSENTIKAFQADLRILTEFLPDVQPIGRISSGDLGDFLVYMARERGRPCNPKSYARRLTTLKVLFDWLAEAGVLPADPAASLVHHPVQTPLPRVLSDGQVEQLRQAAHMLAAGKEPDPRPLLLFELIVQTGIKKGECMGIHLSHLDLTDPAGPTLRVRYEQARQTYKERALRLEPSIVPALRAYRAHYKPTDYLFECTARNLEYVLRDLAQLAGILGGVSFESLRWTAALREYRAGMPDEALRHKLGLSKLRWRETHEKLERLAEPAL